MLRVMQPVDAVLERNLGARARAISREVLGQSEYRQTIFLCASVEMAVSASKAIPRIAVSATRHIRPDVGVGGGDEVPPPPNQHAMRIVGKSPDLRNGPDENRPARALRSGGYASRTHPKARDCDDRQQRKKTRASTLR